jgi:hypothetical protein
MSTDQILLCVLAGLLWWELRSINHKLSKSQDWQKHLWEIEMDKEERRGFK